MGKRISLEPTAFLALNWGVVVLVSLFYAGRTLILRRYTNSFFASDRSDIPLWTTYILYMAITFCLTWYCSAILRARKLDPSQLNPYYDLPEHEVVVHGKMWLFMKVTYIVATWLSRATFLCVYINVRATLKRGPRILLWATTGWCMLGFAVDVALTLAWCRPISTNWKTNGTRCTPWTISTTTVHCLFALTGDILIMLVPIFILRHLHLQRSQRAATAFVMFLGFFCCLLAILRFGLIVFNVLKKNMSKNHTYQDLDLLVAVVECTLLCIASTLPAYRLIWTVRRRKSVRGAMVNGGGMTPERKGSRGTDDSLLEETVDAKEPWEKDIPELGLPTVGVGAAEEKGKC